MMQNFYGSAFEERRLVVKEGDALDLAWARARHEAAVEHVLTKTALSAQSKAVYRAHVLEGRPAGEVAAEFGITKGNVAKIKFRVEGMAAALEGEL